MPQTSECLHAWAHAAATRARTARVATAANTHDVRMGTRVDAAQSASWISTALPLTTCVMVWGLGDASPAHMPWLPIMHDLIGAAASAWTMLQLTLKWVILRRRRASKLSWPGPGLLVMYAMLTLQPALAIASSMLHGTRATLFWTPLPSVLPANPWVALQIDRVHGINAVALLGVITWQIGSALRSVLRQRDAR
jgi:hypothetical protein